MYVMAGDSPDPKREGTLNKNGNYAQPEGHPFARGEGGGIRRGAHRKGVRKPGNAIDFTAHQYLSLSFPIQSCVPTIQIPFSTVHYYLLMRPHYPLLSFITHHFPSLRPHYPSAPSTIYQYPSSLLKEIRIL